MFIKLLAVIGLITLGRWLYAAAIDVLERPARARKRACLRSRAQFRPPEPHAIARTVMRRNKHA
jgi:hypothetical protein